jgi:hypothetical protein
VAAARLAIVSSKLEIGWESIATQWQNASFGWMGLEHTPMGSRIPADQADYWLSEIDRLNVDHAASASVLMGAAWVLDSPGDGFVTNHMRQSQFASFLQMGIELDEKTITVMKSRFRERCRSRCLDLAARTTEKEPTDVRWWRMRALLLFEGDTLWSGQDFEPRVNDWLKILDECTIHDPDNALYDYLAALQLWNQSAAFDLPEGDGSTDDKWLLTVGDENMFALGLQRFLEGQEKTFLAIGEDGFPAIAEFMELSGLRKVDQAENAVNRLVTFRQSTLFLKLWRWLVVRVDDAERKGDTDQQILILHECLRLYDQAISPPETSALNTLTTFGVLRKANYKALRELAIKYSTLLPPSEMDELTTREEELRINTETLQLALQQLQSERLFQTQSVSLPQMVSAVSSASAACLLLFATVILLLATILSRRSDAITRLGFWRHALSWLIGCGGTYVVLGMAPAEMISQEVQTRAIIISIWAMAIILAAIVAWIVIVLLRQRKIRFRLLTLLGVTTGMAVLASFWPVIQFAISSRVEFPPELWLHAKGWNDIEGEVLRKAMKVDNGTWLWATIQWFAHGGLYVGLALSMLISFIWFVSLSSWNAGEGLIHYWTRDIRRRWSGALRFVGRASAVAGACWLLVYLCVAPEAIRSAEATFQYQMRYCRDPRAHWSDIREAQTQIESSPKKMKRIREQVRFDLYGDGEVEIDFNPN